MENKKFDANSAIGFLLIGAILLWWLYQSSQKEAAAVDTKKTEQVTNGTQSGQNTEESPETANFQTDSISDYKENLEGTFGYSSQKASTQNKVSILENDLLQLKIGNKGGQIVEAKIKKFHSHDSLPIYLVKDGNASFNLTLTTQDGKKVQTKNKYFEPELFNDGKSLSMKLKVSENQYLEYVYTIRPDEYMLDFVIRSQGLKNVVNTSDPAILTWKMKAFSHEKSLSYENRYTEIVYGYEDGKDDYTGQGSEDENEDKEIEFIAFKQHFFTSILLADQPFETGKFISRNLVEDEDIDTLFTKGFTAVVPVASVGGEFNKTMNWYYGPTDHDILTSYDRNLDEIVSLGWGIFQWINQYLILPFFGFLMSFLPAGIAIIFLTISIKLLLSPVQYKQYLSQAKMKVLRPEIDELAKKYKDNPMKKQQETMKLQNKAGASPLAGCLPALLQIPILYALFMVFPAVFDLRNKSFLWVDDLSSFDVIAELPFTIPFYGDHVSLFPILASVAIFFSMRLTTGNNMASSQPQQEGMPDMGKMMKYMMFLSPIFMLFFFNNYPSGLSLYYFISNLITIGIILVIKNYIIDEEKIHAKIEENKKKPKKQGKFARKMAEMMEQAEQQKKAQQRRK
ncbi:MAG TPA: membrane protein insertase YidC [Flavobacteriaceae bacterium]|nr:membrane protein insertase YidC [Flavobacteriaceae bacterium]